MVLEKPESDAKELWGLFDLVCLPFDRYDKINKIQPHPFLKRAKKNDGKSFNKFPATKMTSQRSFVGNIKNFWSINFWNYYLVFHCPLVIR